MRRNGDALIGLTGKKYLVESNGMKNPTPSPPLVIASRTLYDNPIRKKYAIKDHHSFDNCLISRKPATTIRRAIIKANNNECEIPRCSNMFPFVILKKNKKTSMSGRIAQIIESIQNLTPVRFENIFPKTIATKLCEITVGIESSVSYSRKIFYYNFSYFLQPFLTLFDSAGNNDAECIPIKSLDTAKIEDTILPDSL
jgi:hypothetical protein